MKNLFSFLCLVCITTFSNAQEVSGKVTDVKGLPIPGVNVIEENAENSSSTDFDGNFIIKSKVGARLKFSMVGYETVTKTASATMNVILVETVKALDEVIVVGYGTRKKGSISGSVSQIKSEDLLRTPAQSAIQAIQGKAAGINIVTNDEPGAAPTINVRGIGTILNSRNPLYVIDGIEAGSLNGISPNDIATIDILKDASSTAIYGQKGVNGVVFITTKKGKKGQVKISYDAYYGQKSILKKVEMSDSYRFAYYNNTALGSSSYFNFNQPVNTNWLDEITRTGEVTSNSVSISGAGEMVSYYLGVSNYTEKGILLGADFKRNNLLNKNEYKFSDKFKVTQLVSLSIADNNPKPLSAFTNAYKQSPIVPVRYANGRFGAPLLNTTTGLADLSGQRFNNVANPVAQLFYTNQKNKNVTLLGGLNAELQLFKNIKFNSNFGATADWGKGYSYTPTRDLWLAQNPSLSAADYLITQGEDAPINTLQQRKTDSYVYNWDNYITYKKQFGNHNLTVVIGMSKSKNNNYEELFATRYNVPENSDYWNLNLASDNSDVAPRSVIFNRISTPEVSLAYFGRAEYDYQGKYMATAIVRREGTSKFQSPVRWGVFPSLSAGWVISKEDFLSNNEFINNLKLRLGYGELANGNGPSFNTTAFNPNSYPFGDPTVSQPGLYVPSIPDPNLTFEKMAEIDLGIDFVLFKNHISGTFDYYNRKAKDLILPVSPPYVISEQPNYVNAGEITNTGIELTLRWDDTIGENIKYYVGGIFSNNKNKVSKISSPYFKNFSGSGSLNNGEYTKMVFEGEPLGSFYVYEQIGYNDDGAPIFNDLVDGVAGLTDKDRVNAGSYIPTYTYSLNFGINYKNVDFAVETYGVGGNKLYNGKKAQRFGGENVEFDVLENFWTPSNTNPDNPKPSNDVPRASTYYIEDGAFFRINNITLGYTLPKIFEKLDRVRLYATAVNPFIFTKFTGYSPEIASNGDPLGGAGIELDAYPTNKTFLFGVNVSF